ncbi:unnamed protein product [Timema podura]|uniref:Uncharacterized protein n=1 Tax=Timema podura TaxID=61482 RepID=A0ABN7NAY0_TIMPD|nr:unnamed protein product [Timema podura]
MDIEFKRDEERGGHGNDVCGKRGEESPFSPGTPQEMLRSLPSPQQVCPPPGGRLTSPAPRMTSPQHRATMGRLVTSPGGFSAQQSIFWRANQNTWNDAAFC